MAIIKCKMCGGDMELTANQRCGTCEYCGSTMTLPKVDDEQRAAAFNRGNHFRRIGEFDKALTVYERIVQEDDGDAEAHWCCALCRFGIEYVKDPVSGEYLPTCHRASFDSFLEDVDYKAALEHADAVARCQYQKDGEKIAQVQRGILSVSQKEQPFDVFICYKESDDQGNRTVDSTLAQDIYYQLTDEGFRVFFSRVTLEDKAGQAYEPYIFAALHSAKVMIVVGTKPEYLNAVWVKNEWSRYLSIVKNDRKKLLIPCYRDMDPYDMPEQLSVLQSYDMSKIGFIQDLIRGISKVIVKESPVQNTAAEPVTVPSETNGNLTALLKRGHMALEDQEWSRADEFFEQVLNLDAECGEAFFGKYLAEQKLSSMNAFIEQELNVRFSSQTIGMFKEKNQEQRKIIEEYTVPGYLEALKISGIIGDFKAEYQSQVADIQNKLQQKTRKLSTETENRLLARAFQYASGRFASELSSARQQVLETLEQKLNAARQADQQEELRVRAAVENHKQQSLETVKKLHNEATEKREADYKKALDLQKRRKYGDAEIIFYRIRDYKDSKERIEQCQKSAGKRMKKIIAVAIAAVVLTAGAIYVYQKAIRPEMTYNNAVKMIENEEYSRAYTTLYTIQNYKDVSDKIQELKPNLYLQGEEYLLQKDYANAAVCFGKAAGHLDARERSMELWKKITNNSSIVSKNNNTVALKADGTVLAAGDNTYNQCNVQDWSNIVAVSCNDSNTFGLTSAGCVVVVGGDKYNQYDVEDWSDIVSICCDYDIFGIKIDGTVVASGSDGWGETDVDNWSDIIAIDCDLSHTVGLKSDGTVVATGNNRKHECDVEEWKDIVKIDCGTDYTVGLKADGTVVATGDNEEGQCNVDNWTNIIDIFCDAYHTVGLKSDGSVVATGRNKDGQCEVESWSDIVSIDCSAWHTVGLRSNGTVVATGYNYHQECDVDHWSDIIHIACGLHQTFGLKSNGTILSTGNNIAGQCNTSGWTDIMLPSNLKEE